MWFSKGYAADLYVNPETGGDTANGLSSEIKATNGPFKTIAHAIKTAKPGDTIHLALLTYTKECVEFRNKSGEPGKPITLDGHGAVIDGSDPLVESDWHEISPGLYRNTILYFKPISSSPAFLMRFALVMNGKLNRMGRSGKGHLDPYKSIADLQIGEWTYQEENEHAYLLKIDPKRTLASYHIRVPTRVSGTEIWGNVSHIVIKNITATHVINDGFGLTSGSAPSERNYKIRDIVYENIKAIECCDDGMSSHADSELRVDGFEVDGCATGIANCGNDVINHLVTKNIHGVDLYYYGGGTHVLKNSYIQVHGNVAPLSLMTQFGNDKWLADPARGALHEGWDHCLLQMENVVFDGSQMPEKSSSKILVSDRCSLEASRITVNHLSTVVAKGGSLKLTKSLILGGSNYEVEIRSGGNWLADENIYDIGQIGLENVFFPLQKFTAYQLASKQDSKSQVRQLDFRKWLAHDVKTNDFPPGIGADIAAMGIGIPSFTK